jgi:hypothetical protein
MTRKILIFLIILFFAVFGGIFYFQWKNSQKGSTIIPRTRKVLLYYYNPEKDKDEQGNIKCSREVWLRSRD